MSEDYDSDSMWAHYANSNKGFCIEYDFNKVKGLPAKDKRYFISMYKVIYKETLDEYSFVPMLEYYFSGKTDKEKLKQANMDTLLRLITKDPEWDKEKEWRIFLCNLDDNKIFADIVSSIIIDERVLKNENAKKLIDLAQKKGWGIKVRKNNSIGTKHIYEELKSEAK